MPRRAAAPSLPLLRSTRRTCQSRSAPPLAFAVPYASNETVLCPRWATDIFTGRLKPFRASRPRAIYIRMHVSRRDRACRRSVTMVARGRRPAQSAAWGAQLRAAWLVGALPSPEAGSGYFTGKRFGRSARWCVMAIAAMPSGPSPALTATFLRPRRAYVAMPTECWLNYAFPQEHWRHLRTTNIIESNSDPFAATSVNGHRGRGPQPRIVRRDRIATIPNCRFEASRTGS